jgi:multidrug efflux pump subunit AcrB
MAIRTALFGSEVSKFKQGEDDYKIFVRLDETKRYDINELMSMNVTFRNQSNGRMVALPISSLAEIKYTSTYNSVQRKDARRTLTVYSNILGDYNSNEVVAQVKNAMASFKMPDGYSYEFTGEQEKQNESQDYFGKAMLIALAAIFLILVAQFKSLMGPVIIMFSVIFSTIGVFLGYVITGSELVIFMFFIGIISLAGVVVNNAIVLIDYSMLLVQERKEALNMPEQDYLSDKEVQKLLVVAGTTRLRPVLLTAITTVLGLIPLAIGLNINFITLITESDPQYFLGGDSVAFWGPLSWTVIYGLTFATILTLVVVPCMYLLFMQRMPKYFAQK